MKICTVCNIREQAPGKSGKCVQCRREYNREHYRNNTQKQIDRTRVNRNKLRDRIKEIKSSTPCNDCGVSYPYYVMDFDHRENKSFNVSKAVALCGWDKIQEEIAKCDVVCSNCHRERTQNRLHL